MQSVRIYYFSGTGNTKKIVDCYQRELSKKNVEVTANAITPTTDTAEQNDFDAVGIAYPVHGFNAPSIVEDFANRLPDGNNRYAFIAKTSGEPLRLNDASSMTVIRILRQKGYRVGREYHYVMPYNMIFRHSDEMAAKMLKTAEGRIPSHCEEILREETGERKYPTAARLMRRVCRIERFGFRRNGRHYKVDGEKCIGCGACVKNCPMKNITVADGKFSFGKNCIGCARCAFNCPTNAITTGLLNFLKVNGRYDFSADDSKATVGRYCHKSYERYFSENA